jgi:bacteriocin-like protein
MSNNSKEEAKAITEENENAGISELTEHELKTVAGGWMGEYAQGGWVPIPPSGGGVLVDALQTNLSQVRGPTRNP